MNRLHFVIALAFAWGASLTHAQEPGGVRVLTDIAYKQGAALTDYERARCRLDVYLPPAGKGFATLVWFHGGGLQKGDKAGTPEDSVKTPLIARSFARAGIAVVVPNYRLSPQAKFPAYVEDAAAAVAWAQANMTQHGADPAKLFVGGHSAGGYLAFMLGMDVRYLTAVGVKPAVIAGYIPVSGQTMTHYTVREERGLAKNSVTADAAAPVHYIRKDTPPMLVLYADRDMVARAEENAYFVAMMQGAGNKGVVGEMVADRNHGTIAAKLDQPDDPGRRAMLDFIRVNSASPSTRPTR